MTLVMGLLQGNKKGQACPLREHIGLRDQLYAKCGLLRRGLHTLLDRANTLERVSCQRISCAMAEESHGESLRSLNRPCIVAERVGAGAPKPNLSLQPDPLNPVKFCIYSNIVSLSGWFESVKVQRNSVRVPPYGESLGKVVNGV
jgi:hypothetical protein